MKIIPYILYLYLLGFHKTILSDLTSLYGVTIDLTALMVCLVAIYKSEQVSLWFALTVAFVAGAADLKILPWELFVLGAIALIVNYLVLRINLDSITSRLLILAGGIFVHKLVISVAISGTDFFTIFFRYILLSTLYTWILGWIYFLYRDGKITWAKFKSLF